jgi:predicted O-methyltransferase YrrM
MSDLSEISKRGRDVGLYYPHGFVTPGTVFAHARRAATRQRLIDSLGRTQTDDVDQWRREMIAAGLEQFGDDWDYLDNVCVTHSFAELAQPKRILEIGVRRGLSTFAAAAGAPEASLHLMDLWMENYGHRANPGPDVIKPGLEAIGHRGSVEFFSGNSHELLPRLFSERPEIMFDLIVVDGDHTDAGAWQDLADVAPRLELGGMLVFDDIAHPGHLGLYAVWRKCLDDLGLRVRSAEYRDHGHGVGIFIRSY